MLLNNHRILITLTACVGLLAGCGGGKELPEYAGKLIPVAGQVQAKGKPLTHATVTFIPKGGTGEQASGVTDAEGKFVLFTPIPGLPVEETQGAVPGEYKVTVSRISMPDGSPVPEGTTEADAMAMKAKETISYHFSDPERTTLTATITEDQNAPIDLVIPK